jgi:hypothetical protein
MSMYQRGDGGDDIRVGVYFSVWAGPGSQALPRLFRFSYFAFALITVSSFEAFPDCQVHHILLASPELERA